VPTWGTASFDFNAIRSINVKQGFRARLLSVLTLTAVLLASGACESKKPAPSSSGRISAASSSPTPSIDPSVASATTAYLGYVAAYAHAANTANFDDPALPQYIGGGLLSLSQHNLRVLAQHGAVELGTPTATVQATSAALSAQPPTVTISACLDYSTYQLVNAKTREPVPGGALKRTRYTTTATVQLYGDGKWRVSADSPHRDTPC
jgi:hypothetical protein